MRHLVRSIEVVAALSAAVVCASLVGWANAGTESEPLDKGGSETALLERQLVASICTTREDVAMAASER